MGFLDRFNEDQKELLAALPYRTGLWVSESDISGGTEASMKEREALEAIITAYAEDVCKSEFVEELMKETIAQRERWPEWRKDVEKVPSECRNIVGLLADYLDRREITFFKHNLMEIAMTVAMAYRELENAESASVRARIYGRYLCNRVASFLRRRRPPTIDELLNVSQAETLALDELMESLGLDKSEGLNAARRPAHAA